MGLFDGIFGGKKAQNQNATNQNSQQNTQNNTQSGFDFQPAVGDITSGQVPSNLDGAMAQAGQIPEMQVPTGSTSPNDYDVNWYTKDTPEATVAPVSPISIDPVMQQPSDNNQTFVEPEPAFSVPDVVFSDQADAAKPVMPPQSDNQSNPLIGDINLDLSGLDSLAGSSQNTVQADFNQPIEQGSITEEKPVNPVFEPQGIQQSQNLENNSMPTTPEQNIEPVEPTPTEVDIQSVNNLSEPQAQQEEPAQQTQEPIANIPDLSNIQLDLPPISSVQVPEPIAEEPKIEETQTEVAPIVQNKPETISLPEQKQTLKFKTVAILGLNGTSVDNTQLPELQNIVGFLKNQKRNIILDSVIALGKDLMSDLKGYPKTEYVIFNPAMTEIQSKTNIDANSGFNISIFSNYLERLKYIVKNSDLFIVVNSGGLHSLTNMMLLWTISYLYGNNGKKTILFGDWSKTINIFKDNSILTQEEIESLITAGHSQEMIDILYKVNENFYSSKAAKVSDYRSVGDENDFIN